MKKIPLIEMFGPTIQGEGIVCGEQTFFIRLGLCDFKCTMCDSMHAVDPKIVKATAQYMTPIEMYQQFMAFVTEKKASHVKSVTLSGGNPAIHDLTDFVALIRAQGFKVNVETQGTKSPKWLAHVDDLTVSPKSPGMGESFNPEVFVAFLNDFIGHAQSSGTTPRISFKIPIFSNQDVEFAAAVLSLLEDFRPYVLNDNFYLSLGNPNPPKFSIGEDGQLSEKLDDENIVSMLLTRYNQLIEELHADPRLGKAKFLPQLHVLLFGNQTGK